MKWMGWSRTDLNLAYPEDVHAAMELLQEEQRQIRERNGDTEQDIEM